MNAVTWIGRKVITWFNLAWELYLLTLLVIKSVVMERGRGRVMVRSIVRKQILFTGVQAFGLITTIAGVVGVFLGALVWLFDDMDTAAWMAPFLQAVFLWLATTTLSPLLIAITVAARSGTAIAAELALMRITGETQVYDAMGVNLYHFVVWPRYAGVVVSVVVLTVYFNTAALATHFLLLWVLDASASLLQPFASVSFADLTEALIKSGVLGLGIAAISCHFGLSARLAQTTQVPIVTTRATVNALIYMFLVSLLVTLASGALQGFQFSFLHYLPV